VSIEKHISLHCDALGCNHVIVLSNLGFGDVAAARRIARDQHGWHTNRRDYCPPCKAIKCDARGIKQCS
jgi:hypothetical protein